jgi:elongation factor G
MSRYLEQGDIDPSSLHETLERTLREGHLVPVCFVSARTGAGILDLLEVIQRHLPNPAEGNPPQFVRGTDGSSFQSKPDPAGHVLAHVFKVVNDPYVGRIGIFRVHQGTITPNSVLYIGEARKSFKVGHLLALQGRDTVEVAALVPGDIGAVAKIDDIVFDCVLHESHDEDLVRMRPLAFPEPMYGLAIAPKRRGDEGRISEVLAKIASEDPTLVIEHDAAQNETVVRGLSELHLRSVLERMTSQFRIEFTTRPPRIPYRETIAAQAAGHARHKKQTGGAGQFGEVYLRVEPLERGAGFEFVDQVKGGVIPHQFIPAVEKGVREVLASGYLAGFPMQDLRVIAYDGKHHPVDSKEVAFVAAGRKAFLDALAKAQPVLLEPIVHIEIVSTHSRIGDIAGDLSSRRGQVNGSDELGDGTTRLRGTVPLAALDGYAGRLKAITQGSGSYSIELSHYDYVPPAQQEAMAQDYARRRSGAED